MLTPPPPQTHTSLWLFGTSDWQLCGWGIQHAAGLSCFPAQNIFILKPSRLRFSGFWKHAECKKCGTIYQIKGCTCRCACRKLHLWCNVTFCSTRQYIIQTFRQRTRSGCGLTGAAEDPGAAKTPTPLNWGTFKQHDYYNNAATIPNKCK